MGSRRGHNEGSLWERKDGNGRVIAVTARVTDRATGKRKASTFKTKAEARVWLEQAKQDERQGRLTAGRSQTVETFAIGWLEQVRHSLKPRTHEIYALCVRRVLPHIGSIRLGALRPAHVQSAYTALLSGGLSARSVQMTHMVLHKALADAMRMDLLGRNVTEGTTVPRPERPDRPTFDPTALARLFRATEGDRFAALRVLLPTAGLRIGEALALKWSDIDFVGRSLVVRRALQRQKDVGLVLTEPKTKKARRTVELSLIATIALQAHKERQTFERKAAKTLWQDNDLVFCSHLGTPLDRDRIQRSWTTALKKAQLPHIRIHDLRHTAATLLLGQGTHPKVVQEMLGHSAIGVTLDVYSHVMPTLHRDAADQMDELLKSRLL